VKFRAGVSRIRDVSAAQPFPDEVPRTPRVGEGAALRVLVAADEPDTVEALRILLRSEGLAMRVATNAAALLEAVSAHEHDVALVDVRCLGPHAPASSSDVLSQIRAIDPTLPVVVMAAWAAVERAAQAVRAGARDYVQKPWESSRLVATLLKEAEIGVALRRARRLEAEAARQRALALPKLVARAPAMASVLQRMDLASASGANVLLVGERGTGRETIARWIHAMSSRADRPFVAFDAARSTDADLLGTIGAPEQPGRLGCLELAHGGTLFIRDLMSMPLSLQAKLVASLKAGEVKPLGSFAARAADVRVYASCDSDPARAVEAGRLLGDLVARVGALEIPVPALRERPEDILPLATQMLERQVAPGARAPVLTAEATAALLEHPWPGNVRELARVVEHAALPSQGRDVALTDLGLDPLVASPQGDVLPLEEVERIAIRRALARTHGNVVSAAHALGLSRSAMYRRLQAHGIRTR
jgi:DNA-binding NtrC family response regulator